MCGILRAHDDDAGVRAPRVPHVNAHQRATTARMVHRRARRPFTLGNTPGFLLRNAPCEPRTPSRARLRFGLNRQRSAQVEATWR